MSRHRRLFVLGVAFVLATLSAPTFAGGPQFHAVWGVMAGQVTFTPGDTCLPTPVITEPSLRGTLPHLGRTRLVATHCATDTGAVNGRAVFMTANGDELWATYTARTLKAPEPPDSPLIVQVADFVVSGGTGRFERAYGRLTASVYI